MSDEDSPFRNDGDYDPAKPKSKRKSYTPNPHRLLPQSPDAEKGVLSSFLIRSRDVGGILAENQITTDHFFIPAHGMIFSRLMQMWDRMEQIDFIILTQKLRDEGKLDQCGGAAFITELFDFLPTAANVQNYVDILKEKFTLREIIRVGTGYVGRAYDEQADVPVLIDGFERDALKIRQSAKSTRVSMKQLVVGAVIQIEEIYANRGSITGLTTGFDALDKLTNGLEPTEMIVIAARPSMGKTAIAMNIAEHIAVDLQKPVAVFSLEMSKEQLVQRLLCGRARVNLARIRDGFLSERDFPSLQVAASKLAEAGIHIDDASGLSIQELKARARQMKAEHNIQALFVDYLQLLTSNVKRREANRQQEVAEISSGLKAIAKELGIPVVVLAQLNRNPESRNGAVRGKPRLSDLRESGSIEQDADKVLLLHREEMYAETEDDKEALSGHALLIVAKQRNGPLDDIPLTFLKEFTRFENRSYEPEPDPVAAPPQPEFDYPKGDPRRGRRRRED